jgi:hypothetical protein
MDLSAGLSGILRLLLVWCDTPTHRPEAQGAVTLWLDCFAIQSVPRVLSFA